MSTSVVIVITLLGLGMVANMVTALSTRHRLDLLYQLSHVREEKSIESRRVHFYQIELLQKEVLRLYEKTYPNDTWTQDELGGIHREEKE